MQSVRLYEKDEVLIDHSLEPLNPHPVFPQWSIYDIYPYQFMGSVQCRPVKKKFKMLFLENEFLRVCVAPDIGGRVWSIYDKLAKRQAINHATKVLTYNAGMGLNYTCGGLEVNYPLAHSCTTSRKREYRAERNSDGSRSIVIGEYDQIWRTRWLLRYTLRPGRSFLEQTVRIYNRGLHDSRYMYWSNCGFCVNDHIQFIFPETAGAMHGNMDTIFSWPLHKGKDLSYWRNVCEPLGLYMLDAEEPYFGYYDHGAEYGMVHYSDLSDLPGKKYWSWGSDFLGRVATARSHNPAGQPYGEMQAGRIVIQEYMDRMPPESEAEWTEYWYPVRKTGGFNGVGRDAALNVRAAKAGQNSTRVSVKALGSGYFPGAHLVVSCAAHPLARRRVSLSPLTATAIEVTVPYQPKEHETACVKLVDSAGVVLAQARLRNTLARDTGLEISCRGQAATAQSAEEMFVAAENLARNGWNNQDECEQYGEALKLDPGLACAHLEIGKLQAFRGNYELAITHLRKALVRTPDNLDCLYSLGVALMLSGREESAARSLEKAARYDFENRARTRLAEIKIREGDFHHALKYLDRILASTGRLTRPLTLQALCLRALGRFDGAKLAAHAALRIDPNDPFPQLEAMLIEKEASKKALEPALGKLLVQLRHYEPPFLEAVMDYGNVHFYADALAILKLFPEPGPLAVLYKAYLEYRLGRAACKRTLLTACQLNPVNHCPWQLELLPVLEWARKLLPRNPRPNFYLGNLLAARRQLEKGVEAWRKAEALGETSHLLYSTLGFYHANVRKDEKTALKYFEKAHRLEPSDPYMKAEIFETLVARGREKQAIKFLQKDLAAVRTYPKLAFLLLTQLTIQKRYKEYDELLPHFHFETNWAVSGPHSTWATRHINEALDKMAANKCAEAIELFNKSLAVPEHLGFSTTDIQRQERVFYHLGRCHEKMGDLAKARSMWEKAVSIERAYDWEPACAYDTWIQRYFQILALKKLGRKSEAHIMLDGLELLGCHSELSKKNREYLMDLVRRGRLADEELHDPYNKAAVAAQFRAEL